MSAIDFGRLDRVLVRCEEVADEPGIHAIITCVYNDVLKSAAKVFRDAHIEVSQKESSQKKEAREAREALDALDRPYRSARATVLAYLPEKRLPETLKSQPTDTDKLIAIEGLLDAINEHTGKVGWADNIVQTEFGTLAPKTVMEMKEAIAADKDLAAAREARAAAFGPAYDRYLAYKRVVRETLGDKSKQYKRIHIRLSAGAQDGDKADAAKPTECSINAPAGA